MSTDIIMTDWQSTHHPTLAWVLAEGKNNQHSAKQESLAQTQRWVINLKFT